MLHIDGSFGEGGGQIVRSALALSVVTGQPFEIHNIRAGRAKPGLMRQHLAAVRAAAEICDGQVQGAAIGAPALTFRPGAVRGGDYHFSIGTAGSTTLVLQTVLLPLLLAGRPGRVTLEGGTHNPHAPPHDFLARCYVPLVNRMGPTVSVHLERPGFYPAGGGRLLVDIEPVARLRGIELLERGAVLGHRARAVVANLPRHIAERELRVVGRELGWDGEALEIEEVRGVAGPGNAVMLEVRCEHVTEVFTGFGERGRRAETVATQAVEQCRRYLESTAPAGEYLTDQLMLPLALAGAGCFRSTGLSSHARTHRELIGLFLETAISERQYEAGGGQLDFG